MILLDEKEAEGSCRERASSHCIAFHRATTPHFGGSTGGSPG